MHQLVSVSWGPPLMCCGRSPDGFAAGSGAKDSRASCTREIGGSAASESGGHWEEFHPAHVFRLGSLVFLPLSHSLALSLSLFCPASLNLLCLTASGPFASLFFWCVFLSYCFFSLVLSTVCFQFLDWLPCLVCDVCCVWAIVILVNVHPSFRKEIRRTTRLELCLE